MSKELKQIRQRLEKYLDENDLDEEDLKELEEIEKKIEYIINYYAIGDY
ncbi:hypothetical protein [Acidianus ambivalens]|nr:hypothetical protein [Acidianus ambivalens]